MRGCPAISYGWGRGHVRRTTAPSRASASPRSPSRRRRCAPPSPRRSTGARRRRFLGSAVRRLVRPRRGERGSRRGCGLGRPPPRSALGAAAAWCAPAAAPVVPAVSRALRHPAAPSERPRDRAHLRRRASSARARRTCSRSSSAPVRRRPSTWSASRSSASPGRSRPRSPPPGTRSASTATGTRCSFGAPPPSWPTTSTAPAPSSARRPAPRASPTGRRTASSASPGCGCPRPLAAAALVALGARLGGEGDAVVDRGSRDARARPGAVILLHDSDAYSAAESWRQTVAALPAVLEAAPATGEPLVTASQST